MRILQVVTLHSPDAAYGGPLRVALNQSAALRARGHSVDLAATSRGYSTPPRDPNGIPLHLFPARQLVPRSGFAGLGSPSMLLWLNQTLKQYDLIHVHLARDLVTMPAAALALRHRTPLVLQTHGMIDPSQRSLAPLFDSLLTRHVLQRAKTVCYLTDHEARSLRLVAGSLPLRKLKNGVPSHALPDRERAAPHEVLFMARLQERKRPMAFARAAARLASEFPDVIFTLTGPDEGEGPALDAFISSLPDSALVRRETAVPTEDALARIGAADIYVLPSVHEPYPMTVLEAMSVGVPPIVTRSCGLAGVLKSSGSGVVVDESEHQLTAAIRQLLSDPEARLRMSATARAVAMEQFSMEAIADELEMIYRSPVGS